MIKRHSRLLAFGLVSLAACGSSSSVSVTDFQTKFVGQECSNSVECLESTDEATCEKAQLTASTDSLTLTADVKSGVVKFDASAADKCLAELGADPCEFTGTVSTTPDCAKVLTGTLAMGAACFSTAECAGGATCTSTTTSCDTSISCCPGTCGAPPPAAVAIGGACGSTTGACVTGSYCKTASGTCTAVAVGVGTACDTSESACGAPLYCQPGSSGGTGMCVQPAATGAACVLANELPCVDLRDYCDPTSKVCTRAVAVGATCAQDRSIQCIGTATCVATKCVANPVAGGPCSTTADAPACPGSTSCVGGTCVLPTAAAACH